MKSLSTWNEKPCQLFRSLSVSSYLALWGREGQKQAVMSRQIFHVGTIALIISSQTNGKQTTTKWEGGNFPDMTCIWHHFLISAHWCLSCKISWSRSWFLAKDATIQHMLKSLARLYKIPRSCFLAWLLEKCLCTALAEDLNICEASKTVNAEERDLTRVWPPSSLSNHLQTH